MTVAHSHPYVPLEKFLEMEPEPGTWLEWCAGLVYAMSGGSPEHSRLCVKLSSLFLSRLGQDCTIFDSKVDIWVEAAQFYGQADVSVVCGAIHSHTVKKNGKVLGEAITNPQIIVEVLSPSTAARDRGEKFEAYKQALSLKEYVLVSQDEQRVEVRRRDERGWSVDVAGPGDVLRIHGHDISVDSIYSASSP
ncbi:MAG: Uma2 family endonuclease [Labilithrix sp.]|nr:Uma2 family endonuclease [Labilithrix sp.]MBX3220848.1 Uma2 family endonuclease [Labilithrix sp.]